MSFWKRGLITAGIWLAAGAAQAQFPQYTAPGSLAEIAIPAKEELEEAMAEARWRLGPVRLEPELGIRNLTYWDDVFPEREEDVSDVTASGEVGLSAYLPFGPKVVLAASALPEYTWWREREELRAWRGRYGAGLFGDLNRLRLEIKGIRTDEERPPNLELLAPVGIEEDRGEAAFEIDLRGPFAFFVGASLARFDHEVLDALESAPLPVRSLDREETALRGGLRYRPSERLAVGLGVESSEVEFDDPLKDRSNSGEGPLLEVELRGRRVQLSLAAVHRRLDAEEGSEFRSTDFTSGQAQIAWKPRGRFRFALYGVRSLIYSLAADRSTSEDERAGLAVDFPLGWRAEVRFFGEAGRSDFASTDPGIPAREDDLTSYGGTLTVELWRGVRLALGAARIELDSNLPGFDRDLTTFRSGLTFGTGSSSPLFR